MNNENESRAVGGPLHGVKISAGSSWDGRISYELTGIYRWMNNAWHWSLLEKPLPSRTGRPPLKATKD